MCKFMTDCASFSLPKIPKRQAARRISPEILSLLNYRQQFINDGDLEAAKRITKKIKRKRKAEKEQNTLDSFCSQLDLRDRWCGLAALRKTHSGTPFSRKDSSGAHIPLHLQAEETAEFLAQKTWGGNSNNAHADFPTNKIKPDCPPVFNLEEFSIEELNQTIKALKRRKAGGPDNTTAEMFIELDEVGRKSLLNILNEWWCKSHVPAEVLRARVVLIFKKGDPEDLNNYRPISLFLYLRNMREQDSLSHSRFCRLNFYISKPHFGS